MPHLMPHHVKQFVLIEFCDGRVPQDDALGGAEAGDVGVERFCVLTLCDLVNSPALDARALSQLKNFCLKLLVLHRPEFVEERIDPDRLNKDYQNEERNRQQRSEEHTSEL